MAIVRGTREGSPQRVDVPDADAAALVAAGDAEYLTEEKPAPKRRPARKPKTEA